METVSTNLLVHVVKAVASNLGNFSRNKSDILSDLNLIRFVDEGVLALIDSVIAGERPKREMVEETLTSFNDHQWAVARATERLANEFGPVSQISREDLQLISWEKTDVRREVQDAMNLWGRGRFSPNIEKLTKVRSSIDDLNKAIDEIEHMLIHGAQ